MRWQPASLHAFGSDAGFMRPDLYTATACALAASGGHDTHDIATGIPGTGRYRGLWGLDIDEYPIYAARDLHDPYVAAQTAYELTTASQGFGWCPVFRSGAYAQHRETAVAAAGGVPWTEVVHLPIVGTVLQPHVANLRDQHVRRTVRMGQWLTSIRS